MLIVALILAVIGLAALVTAVVTSNELIAWVCIGASALGVLLLIVDAIRERSHRRAHPAVVAAEATPEVETTEVIPPVSQVETTEVIAPVEVVDDETVATAEHFADGAEAELIAEDYPDEVVHDEPDFDTASDDEPDFGESAEELAIHTITEEDLIQEELADDAGEYVGSVTEGDGYTTEVHYVSSAEGSADTVVYPYAENSEIEIIDVKQSETSEHDRDH